MSRLVGVGETPTPRLGDGRATVGGDDRGGQMGRLAGVGETPTPRLEDGRATAGRKARYGSRKTGGL